MENRLQINRKKNFYGLYSFLIALVTAAVIFVPFIILNDGVFYYYGDFNFQEIPFYQLVHSQVKSGNLSWSNLTDLGSDTISSYSFYLLGSPFFWLTIPFSNESVPYLIGPILILKFAFASLSAYTYTKRYVTNKWYAVIGGILYAFSGFSTYNVFFFHFHEPMIVFPFLLAALDAFLYDKKRGVFAIAVFSACVINYYFFVGQALFVAIYFFLLVFTKTYKFKIKEFLLLTLEVIIGFLATAVILLPSILGIMGNPRLAEYPNGWGSIVYEQAQRYWLIITAFFFPADLPAYPTYTPNSDCKWASVAAYLPLIGMTGVIAYMQLQMRDWIKKLISILILMAFVPVLNSAFQLFNSSIFYTRWYYMLVLVMVLATVRAFENKQVDWSRAIKWSTSITIGMITLVGAMPKIEENDDGEEFLSGIGVQSNPERFWICSLVAVCFILFFVLIYKKHTTTTPNFIKAFIPFLCLSIFLSSFLTIGFVTFQNYSNIETIKNDVLNKEDVIASYFINDKDNFDAMRFDFYECSDNTAMYFKLPSINCFHSCVSTSIMQFYDKIGMARDVASRPPTSLYAIRSLLSCKYLFDYSGDDSYDNANKFVIENNTRMIDWEFKCFASGHRIYENKNYIPMGFSYNSYITNEELERLPNLNRSEIMLKSMVLSKEQMIKYSDITGYIPEKYALLYSENPKDFHSSVESYLFTNENFRKNCAERAENSCSKFEYTDNGFYAVYDNSGEDTLVFFSVPYSDGFTAFVNGKETDIEKVNVGFMAVKVDGHRENTIEFRYKTPGLSTGINITLISLLAFMIYISLLFIFKNKIKTKRQISSSTNNLQNSNKIDNINKKITTDVNTENI